jgi:hypothetical protein
MWGIAFWLALLIAVAVWGKGWQKGPLIAASLLAGIAQGLMAVDVISAWKAGGRPGHRQWFFIAVLISLAIVFALTEWWRLYVVTLGLAFSIVLIYLFSTSRSSRS